MLLLLGLGLVFQFLGNTFMNGHNGFMLSTATAETPELAGKRVIRAQAFEVVNEKGKVLARLSNEYESPRLRFFEATGICRSEFGIEVQRSSSSDLDSEIILCDSEGNRRILITSSNAGSSIVFRDSQEKKQLRLGTDDKQTPKIEILDRNGEKAVWEVPGG